MKVHDRTRSTIAIIRLGRAGHHGDRHLCLVNHLACDRSEAVVELDQRHRPYAGMCGFDLKLDLLQHGHRRPSTAPSTVPGT